MIMLDVFPGHEADEGWWSMPAKNAILTGNWAYGGRPHVFLSPVFCGLTYGVYRIFGIGIVQARSISAIFGLFSIVLVFLIGRRLYGTKIGLISAFFYGMNAFVININRKAFVESVQIFFIMLSFYYWISSKDSKRMLSGVFFGLAMLTKLNIYFILVPFFIWEVLRVSLQSPFSLKVRYLFSRTNIRECFRLIIPAVIVFFSVHLVMFLLDRDNYILSYRIVAQSKYYLNPEAMLESLKYILITAPFLFLFSTLLCINAVIQRNVTASRWTLMWWYGFVLFWLCIVSGYQPNRFFMILYPVMALLSADFLNHIKDFWPKRLKKRLSSSREKLMIVVLLIAITGFQSLSLAARYFRFRDDTEKKISLYLREKIDATARVGGYSVFCLDIPNVCVDIYARRGGLFSRLGYTREYIIREYNIRYILFNRDLSHVGYHPFFSQYLNQNGELLTTIGTFEIWKLDLPKIE